MISSMQEDQKMTDEQYKRLIRVYELIDCGKFGKQKFY